MILRKVWQHLDEKLKKPNSRTKTVKYYVQVIFCNFENTKGENTSFSCEGSWEKFSQQSNTSLSKICPKNLIIYNVLNTYIVITLDSWSCYLIQFIIPFGMNCFQFNLV